MTIIRSKTQLDFNVTPETQNRFDHKSLPQFDGNSENALFLSSKLTSANSLEQTISISLKPAKKPEKPSVVIFLIDLRNFFESAAEIYNLTSSFGAVKRVLFLRNQQKALIEYYIIADANRCIFNLNQNCNNSLNFRAFFQSFKLLTRKPV